MIVILSGIVFFIVKLKTNKNTINKFEFNFILNLTINAFEIMLPLCVSNWEEKNYIFFNSLSGNFLSIYLYKSWFVTIAEKSG